MSHSSVKTKKKKADVQPSSRTALITAPVATDTTLIRQILSAEGVKSFSLDELGVPGESLHNIVEEAIDQADMVVAVFPKNSAKENLLIELGFALASRKPILILADDAAPLPELASHIPYLRGALDDGDALRFGVAQFLKAPRMRTDSALPVTKQSRPLGDQADSLIAKLQGLPESGQESAITALIVEAIRMSGVSTLSEGGPVGDSRVDVAVWSDDIEPWISNPLLIEVKRTLRGKGDLDAVVSRFRRAYGNRQPGWGLVIYKEAAKDANLDKVKHLDPTILFMSVYDFLESLRTTGFGDLILRLRNDRVHGRG